MSNTSWYPQKSSSFLYEWYFTSTDKDKVIQTIISTDALTSLKGWSPTITYMDGKLAYGFTDVHTYQGIDYRLNNIMVLVTGL